MEKRQIFKNDTFKTAYVVMRNYEHEMDGIISSIPVAICLKKQDAQWEMDRLNHIVPLNQSFITYTMIETELMEKLTIK